MAGAGGDGLPHLGDDEANRAAGRESSPKRPLGEPGQEEAAVEHVGPRSKLEVADPNTEATKGRVSTTRSLFMTGPTIWDWAAGVIRS